MLRSIGLTVLCANLSGCGNEADLAQKREEWQSKAPATYVVGTCTTGFAIGACQLYAVDHGVVATAEVRTPASSEWKPSTDTEEPIARLFASAELGQSGCTRSIEFDESYSYPKKIYFDCGEEGSGEEVRCFEADTLDLEACRARTVR